MEFSSMLGFLNELFWPEPYRRTRRDVNFCLMLDEKPSVVAGGVVGEPSGCARKVLRVVLALNSSKQRRQLALAGSFDCSDRLE
jgi:hypothetical protein